MKFLRKVIWINLGYNCINIKNIHLLMLIKYLNLGFNKCMVSEIFQQILPSELKLPKLHSWIHHTIDSIWIFGAINGYTIETYESLYKKYVKIPYCLSNKKNIKIQIMKTISN